MIEFYQPQSTGEWLAFASAIVAILAGLAAIFVPARWAGHAVATADPVLAGAMRAAGGFPLGLGLASIILAQPLVYLALGAGWLLAAVGRAVGLVADRTSPASAVARLAADVVLALLPLAYVFGYVP